ncbi:unnamed protein product [Durusdinium trenchii]|uniref:Uncharacterized protein n=1 Tax=Durusdinium trenchii TaxID=1381693 RepID=A0ABP0J436_9DINO
MAVLAQRPSSLRSRHGGLDGVSHDWPDEAFVGSRATTLGPLQWGGRQDRIATQRGWAPSKSCKELQDPFLMPGNGCYLAGFNGTFPEVPCGWEEIEPPLCGAVEQLAKQNKDLARYLFNNVKVCVQCLRACAYSQKACQACGTPLETVPVTQTENVLMGFIFGVEKTSKFSLVISLRRQTVDAIVYDDLLAMSSCHLNALPTNHYVADWIWLLRDPTGAKQLIDTLVQEAWEATRSFLDNAEWRRFIYKEGVTEEMIRQNIMCGFNSPPSQSQLHLQWIVLPLLPFHHQKLLDRTHAQKGRWFPLEYVLPILDHLEQAGEVFEVNGQTSAEDVIKHFNGKGIVYDHIWEQSYARYCASYAAVANWNPQAWRRCYTSTEGRNKKL